MCYFRDLTTSSYSSSQWKLYNDTGTTTFYSFKDLIIDCAETLQRPTVIFYEKFVQSTSIYQSSYYYSKLIETYHLGDLERKAEHLDIQYLSLGGGVDNQDTDSVKLQQMLLDQCAKDRQISQEAQSPVSTKIKEEVKEDVVIQAVDAEKELRDLKRRLYIENGVYLYKCERCEHLVALHQQ